MFGGVEEHDTNTYMNSAFGGMSEGGASNYGKVGKKIYQGSQSIGELVADYFFSAGAGKIFGLVNSGNKAKTAAKAASIINSTLQSSKVANQTANKYKEEGASDSEATAMGVVNGLIEFAVEKYTFDKLLKSPAILTGASGKELAKGFAKKVGADFVSEGGEEVVTNWITSLAAYITDNNEHDELLSAYEKAKAEGLSEGEAAWSAFKNMLPQYAEEFIVGGFAGALFGGSNTYSTLKAAETVRYDAGDFFINSGLSRESVEEYLVLNGMESTEEIAKYTNAIIDKASGKTVDKKLDYEINETPLFRGIVQAYADVTLEEAQRREYARTAATKSPLIKAEPKGPSVSERLNAATQNITNTKAEAIINDAELKTELEKLAGVKIEGTKAEQRAIVKDNATKVNEALKISNISEGDVFFFPEENKTYKVVAKGEKSTTFEVSSESGTITKKMSNNLLTTRFTDDKRVDSSSNALDIGRIGANIFEEYAGRNGKLVSEMTDRGMSKTEAQENATAMFSFLYARGRANANKDLAIQAVTEVYGSEYINDYDLFYTAGKFDADRQLRGKKGAGIVQSNALNTVKKSKSFSNKTYRAIEAIAKKSGFDIEFVDEIDGGGNASFDTATGKFLVSTKTTNPFLTAVVHEVIHAGRSVDTKSYTQLRNLVVEILGKDARVLGDAFSNRLSLYKSEATREDGTINSDLVTEEMVAEVVSHIVSGDTQYIESLAKQDRNFVQRIYDAVKSFFEKALKRYTGDTKTELSPEIQAAVDMLKSEQARVIKAFDNILNKSEIMQGRRVKTAGNTGIEISKETQIKKDIENQSDIVYSKSKYNQNDWIPDLSKKRLKELYKIIHRDAERGNKYVTENVKWVFTSIDGEKVFALYSIVYLDNPTLMYESKGQQAILERDYLLELLEDEYYGQNINGESSFVKRVSKRNWVSNVNSGSNSVGNLGTRGRNSNVGILSRQSRRKPRPAFISSLEYIFGIQSKTGKLKSKSETDARTKLNTVPTKLFSLSKPVEETNDLIAVHNLTQEQVVEVIQRGQFIMPSVAVTNLPHTAFGDVSIVFDKNTIDPQLNANNKLYGSDAWTPAQTKLKKNPVFDRALVKDTLKDIKSKIGTDYEQIFDVESNDFMNTINASDGSIFDAYANNIGFQTAYAVENRLIKSVPRTEDGKIDRAMLQDQLEEKLDKDSEWRKYKKWLGKISDNVITSYDQASNEDILNNMKAQPNSAKRFKLTENGELTVPAVEYSSIEQFRENKGRLSKNADAMAKYVGRNFISWAKGIMKNSDASLRNVIKGINAAFDSRYDSGDIVKVFADNDVSITASQATTLQKLYKKAVELPTPYFEAKPQRAVGLNEVAMFIVPDSATNLINILEANNIPYTVYKKGDNAQRINALNSIPDVMFSKPDINTEYLELAKNPEQNVERLRELVDEAAKEAGYEVEMFHETDAENIHISISQEEHTEAQIVKLLMEYSQSQATRTLDLEANR